jgi:hypothetical protein
MSTFLYQYEKGKTGVQVVRGINLSIFENATATFADSDFSVRSHCRIRRRMERPVAFLGA